MAYWKAFEPATPEPVEELSERAARRLLLAVPPGMLTEEQKRVRADFLAAVTGYHPRRYVVPARRLIDRPGMPEK